MYYSALMIDVGDNPDRPRPGRTWLRNLYHVHQRLCMAFPATTRQADDRDFLQPYRPEDFAADQVHVPRGNYAGFLFRIDAVVGGGAVILVQSANLPDWGYAFHNAGHLLATAPQVWEKELDFTVGQQFKFRLLANPTRKVGTAPKSARSAEPPCTCRRSERSTESGVANTPHAPDCPVRAYRDSVRPHGRRLPVGAERDSLVAWLADRGPGGGFALVAQDTESLIIQPGYAYARVPAPGKGLEATPVRYRAVRYDGVLVVTDADRLRETVIRGIGPAKSFGFGLLSLAPLR